MSECLEKHSNLIRLTSWQRIISPLGQSFGATIKNRRAAWGIVSPPKYSPRTTDRRKVSSLTCGRVALLWYFYSVCLKEHLLCISLPSTHTPSHIKSIPVIIALHCSIKKEKKKVFFMASSNSEHEFEHDKMEIKDDNIRIRCVIFRDRE